MGERVDHASAPGAAGLKGFSISQGEFRVRFGTGALARVPDEVDALGVERVVVVASASARPAAERVRDALGIRCVEVRSGARQHVPAADAAAAAEGFRSARAGGLVALGGGSAIGLAKAVALATGAPVVAVPTTYSGSEMTPVYGITEGGRKRTGRDPRVRPRAVVYDPDLTASLPVEVAAASGMNALAHAVEALYARDRSPVSALLAGEAFRTMVRALPGVAAPPAGAGPRHGAMLGGFLAGWALSITTTGLHHKLAHVLGGTFGLPHAQTHAVLLPHVIAFQEPAAPELGALGPDAPGTVARLLASLPLPKSLAELGFDEGDVPRAVAEVMEAPPPGPRPVTAEDVEMILRGARGGAWA